MKNKTKRCWTDGHVRGRILLQINQMWCVRCRAIQPLLDPSHVESQCSKTLIISVQHESAGPLVQECVVLVWDVHPGRSDKFWKTWWRMIIIQDRSDCRAINTTGSPRYWSTTETFKICLEDYFKAFFAERARKFYFLVVHWYMSLRRLRFPFRRHFLTSMRRTMSEDSRFMLIVFIRLIRLCW